MSLSLPAEIMALAEADDKEGLLKIARRGSHADRVDAIVALAAISESKDAMSKVVMQALEDQPGDVVRGFLVRLLGGP